MPQCDVDQLKKLCRIELSSEEEENIRESLERMLDYIDKLNEIDTEGVEPCRFVLRTMLKHQMRDDVVQDTLSRELFLSNSPAQMGGMIKVPPVLRDSR